MEFRSTNNVGYAHFQGDLVTNVSSNAAGPSSHGIHLTGGSTGGIVTAAGDETNIALNIRPKGTGPLNLISSGALTMSANGAYGLTSSGTITLTSTNVTIASTKVAVSSASVTFSSGATMQLGSTAPWGGFVRYQDTAISTPATFNDTTCGRVAEVDVTLTGASSNTAGVSGYYLFANSQNLPAGVSIAGAYVGSTTDNCHVRMVKGSTVAVAATTCTLQFLLVRF